MSLWIQFMEMRSAYEMAERLGTKFETEVRKGKNIYRGRAKNVPQEFFKAVESEVNCYLGLMEDLTSPWGEIQVEIFLCEERNWIIMKGWIQPLFLTK